MKPKPTRKTPRRPAPTKPALPPCPTGQRIRRVEYHESGAVKSVEFEPVPIVAAPKEIRDLIEDLRRRRDTQPAPPPWVHPPVPRIPPWPAPRPWCPSDPWHPPEIVWSTPGEGSQ